MKELKVTLTRNFAVHSYDEWMCYIFDEIMEEGYPVPSRVGDTQELLCPRMNLMYPKNRYSVNPERKHNIYALLAETLWVLRGSNDCNWLEHYLPRAKDFSDDGTTWRAGYGPRLRRWGAVPWQQGYTQPVVDQVQAIVNELKRDPGSRQAVMMIWNPTVDLPVFGKTKDMPCNNWLHFIQRNGELHLAATIRSNDMVWGNMINVFEWATLQDIMAAILGYKIGNLVIQSTSSHIYTHHFERAKKISRWYLDNLYSQRYDGLKDQTPSFSSGTLEQFDESMQEIYDIAANINGVENSSRVMDEQACFETFDWMMDEDGPGTSIARYFGWILTKTKNEQFNKSIDRILRPYLNVMHPDFARNINGLGQNEG